MAADEDEWWDEEPARRLPAGNVTRTLMYSNHPKARKGRFESAEEYVRCVFRNNVNLAHNARDESVQWEAVNSRAASYRWKSGVAPTHRKYKVSFTHGVAAYTLELGLKIASDVPCCCTLWSEVVVGNTLQVYIEGVGPYARYIFPLTLRAIAHESRDSGEFELSVWVERSVDDDHLCKDMGFLESLSCISLNNRIMYACSDYLQQVFFSGDLGSKAD